MFSSELTWRARVRLPERITERQAPESESQPSMGKSMANRELVRRLALHVKKNMAISAAGIIVISSTRRSGMMSPENTGMVTLDGTKKNSKSAWTAVGV